MSNPEEYDLVVLGSGEGGKILSWTMASHGKRSAVVERRYVGGSCPNIACLPSKNIVHGAKVASYFRRGRVRDRRRRLEGRHGLGPRSQAQDGRRARRDASRQVPGERCGARHGAGPLRRAEDDRGGAVRGRDARPPRESRGDQYRYARTDRSDPGPPRGAPADAHRSPRAGPGSGTSPGPGRRLRRPRTGPGVSSLRQPRDHYRTERLPVAPRGSGRLGSRATALYRRRDRRPREHDRRPGRRVVRPFRAAACDADGAAS